MKVVDVRKDITPINKRLGCVTLAYTDYKKALLSDSCSQAGVVAVARYQAKGVYTAGIKSVHRINNQGAVSSIFPRGIPKLLDRLEGMGM